MSTWKKFLLLGVAAVVAVTLFVTGLSCLHHKTSEKDNSLTLERLDQISKRLSEIWLRVEVIDGQISELESEKDNLIEEQTALNDEASSLFLSLVTPEMIEPKKEFVSCLGCSHYDSWTNSCIEWDAWSKWCESNFSGDIKDYSQTEWQPGQLTEDGTNQVMPESDGETPHERFKQIAYAYWLNPSTIWEVENHYGITEGVVLCITIAETSWGKFWAGKWNIWNVWNNDRGDRVTFALADTGLEKIGQTLTNSLLWGHQTLWCLSNWHHCEEPTDNGKRYATSSPETSWAWEPNMVACLSQIYGEDINPATFNIRNR